MADTFSFTDGEDKAGYNAAARISEALGFLRNTYISNKMEENHVKSLECIRAILDIISGKVPIEKIQEIDKEIYNVEDNLPKSQETFRHNGNIFIKFPQARKQIKRSIEQLYRKVEKLEDQYGYGMLSKSDPSMAVLKR